MSRNEQGLKKALASIPQLREEFWNNLRVTGRDRELNMELERAGRVADFIDFSELICLDALNRRESCGGHFREEFQTEEGEALRNDKDFAHVSVWEYQGEGKPPLKRQEELVYEEVAMTTRSYK